MPGYRDEREALLARAAALETELAETREKLGAAERKAELDALRARVAGLETALTRARLETEALQAEKLADQSVSVPSPGPSVFFVTMLLGVTLVGTLVSGIIAVVTFVAEALGVGGIDGGDPVLMTQGPAIGAVIALVVYLGVARHLLPEHVEEPRSPPSLFEGGFLGLGLGMAFAVSGTTIYNRLWPSTPPALSGGLAVLLMLVPGPILGLGVTLLLRLARRARAGGNQH